MTDFDNFYDETNETYNFDVFTDRDYMKSVRIKDSAIMLIEADVRELREWAEYHKEISKDNEYIAKYEVPEDLDDELITRYTLQLVSGEIEIFYKYEEDEFFYSYNDVDKLFRYFAERNEASND